MPININYCAPFVPNDPTIEFHRYFLTVTLIIESTVLFFLYIYAHYSSKPIPEQSEVEESSSQSSNKQSQMDIPVPSISENESCIELKKTKDMDRTGPTYNRNSEEKSLEKEEKESEESEKKSKEKSEFSEEEKIEVLSSELRNDLNEYGPIVYGHFAVTMAAAILFAPYAEQTIAGILYAGLSMGLVALKRKEHHRMSLGVWIFMVICTIFMLSNVLLEVGQSSYDKIKNSCFSHNYVGLYD